MPSRTEPADHLDPIEAARRRTALSDKDRELLDRVTRTSDDREAERLDWLHHGALVCVVQAVRRWRATNPARPFAETEEEREAAHAILEALANLDAIEASYPPGYSHQRNGVCGECGCTAHAACVDDAGEVCAWADESETLCTACACATGGA